MLGAEALSRETARGFRPSILLAEDEVLTRLALATVLRDQGYQVVETASAEEALAVLRTASPVELVLTDVDMSGPLNGVDLARHVRATLPGLPVMIVSASRPDRLTGAPADAVMAKPYDMDVLLAKVRELLDDDGHGR